MTDPMVNREAREELRGAEEETFDLMAQALTSEQWAELLRAPLERAAADGNRGLAQKLVGAGAKIGDALHEATRGGHGDVVSDLLENGASVDAKDTSHCGNTPLHVAARSGETEMVRLLLLKGADKDTMNNIGTTPLHLAALNSCVAAALALMVGGADVSILCDQYNRSVVHGAAEIGLVEVIRAAIERGADVDAVDVDQKTPLQLATQYDRVGAINVLLEAGANVEARDDEDYTPLHRAAIQTSPEAVLALLKHGADVNAQDVYQYTPLQRAVIDTWEQGTAEIVDSLLRSGADETILDMHGRTAADVVAEEVEAGHPVTEEIARVRELLANAPADRAWRRRGYLMLCRARPNRMQQIQDTISSAQMGTAGRNRNSAKMARIETNNCTGTVGSNTVGGRAGGDWVVVMARVLALQQEGIFRTIVGFL